MEFVYLLNWHGIEPNPDQYRVIIAGIPYLELQVSGRQDGEELLCTLNHVPKTRKLESDFRACIHKPSASRRDGLGPGPLLFIMIWKAKTDIRLALVLCEYRPWTVELCLICWKLGQWQLVFIFFNKKQPFFNTSVISGILDVNVKDTAFKSQGFVLMWWIVNTFYPAFPCHIS